IALDDVVTGDTSGALSLVQGATGGAGIWSAGAASSRLWREGSYSSLHVETLAAGGNAMANLPSGADPTAPATGSAESVAYNHGGSAEAVASAIGGGNAFMTTGHGVTTGADADAEADATSDGGFGASATAQSQGGSAGNSHSGSLELGSGGAAHSL